MIEEHDFEREVLRIARYLWSSDEYSGSYNIDGRERDGIFETEDCVHFIEATTSRKKEKAEQDIFKIVNLIKKEILKSNSKGIRGWFVTMDEPTADQRGVLKNKAFSQYQSYIKELSFSQFQSKIVDVRDYFRLRDNHPFGSVRDPGTDSFDPKSGYIELDYCDHETKEPVTIQELTNDLLNGKQMVLLGDYGSGKSMTIRQIYQNIKTMYIKGDTSKFPIVINLREHFGQDDPSEIVERHARKIGYSNPNHLVRAWKSGYGILLLDGFDEISTYGINGSWKRLKDIRFKSVEPIRNIVTYNPSGLGILIAGRVFFIEDDNELRTALGVNKNSSITNLSDFSEAQVEAYLKKYSIDTPVPNWLPTRPLFIGHLAANGVLQEYISNNVNETILDASQGWDLLIDMICKRESRISTNIDGKTTRKIIERLSTYARRFYDGLGPISKEIITRTYEEICQFPIDEKALIMIQRFPGLGLYSSEDDSRKFVDEQFVDICRVGDVRNFIENPYHDQALLSDKIECPLGELALNYLCYLSEGISSKKIESILSFLSQHGGSPVLLFDMFKFTDAMSASITSPIVIKELLISDLQFNETTSNLGSFIFQGCYIESVDLEGVLDPENIPIFQNCIIDNIFGRTSFEDLPVGRFSEDCEIQHYSTNTKTTSGIKDLDLPPNQKVLLVILKKLFIQSLSGRKEKALYAGLDLTERRLVPEVIKLLKGRNMVIEYKRSGLTIWILEKSSYKRVLKILSNPHESRDELLNACLDL